MSESIEQRAELIRRAATAGSGEQVLVLLRDRSEADRKALRNAALPEIQATLDAMLTPLAQTLGVPLPPGMEGLLGGMQVLVHGFDPRKQEPLEDRQRRLAACRLAVVGLGTRRD